MKKLSIILVLALVLTALAAMFVMNTAAEDTRPDANAPETIKDIYDIREGKPEQEDYAGYKLLQFHCDECALKGASTHGGDTDTTPAIGRFTKEGGDGYATSWANVGANSNDCKDAATGKGVSTFYLIGDITTVGSFNLGTTGRPLTIDGSLGQLRTEGENAGKNYSVKSASTILSVTGGDKSSLTLKNATFNCTGVAKAIFYKAGGTITLGEGASIISGAHGVSLGSASSVANLVVDGGSIDAVKNGVVVEKDYAAGQTITVNSGIIDGEYRGIMFDGSSEAPSTSANAVVTVNGGTVTSALRAIQLSEGTSNSTITITGGAIYGGDGSYVICTKGNNSTVNVTGGVINGPEAKTFGVIMLQGANNVANVTGGTINGTNAVGAVSPYGKGSRANISDEATINVKTKIYFQEKASNSLSTSAKDAIVRVGANDSETSGKIYATSWSQVATYLNDGGTGAFYLMGDCTTNRIGETNALKLNGGVTLTIDGINGATADKKGYSMSAERVFHFGAGSIGEEGNPATIILKNVEISGTSGGVVQANDGAYVNMTFSTGSKVTCNANGVVWFAGGCTLTFEEDAYCTSSGIVVHSGGGGACTVIVKDNAYLEANGAQAIYFTNDKYNLADGKTFIMTGGTLVSNVNRAIYSSVVCTIDISGGTITAPTDIIYLAKAGSTVTISGDAVLGGAETHSVINVSGDNDADKAKITSTINIQGGTLQGYATGSAIPERDEEGNIIYQLDSEGNPTKNQVVKYASASVIFANGTLNISGGTISGPRPVQIWPRANCDITVTGGTITATTGAYAIDVKSTNNTIIIDGETAKLTKNSTTKDYGTIMLEGKSNIVEVKNGLVDGVKSHGIWDHVGGNTIKVSGGVVTGNVAGIANRNVAAGTVIEVSGGLVGAPTTSTKTSTSEYISGIQTNGQTTVRVSGGTVYAYYGINLTSGVSTVEHSGGTVKGTKRGVWFNDASTVTISGDAYLYGEQAVTFNSNGGTVNVTGGKVEGLIPFGMEENKTFTLNITGGTVETGTTGQGVIRGHKGTATVTVSGNPTIICGSSPFWSDYYNNAAADITISGGTFTSNSHMFQVSKSGSLALKISGGNFTAAFSLVNAKKGSVDVDVTGGTIDGGNYGFIIQTSDVKLDISGDNTSVTAKVSAIVNNMGDRAQITINGGTFTADGNTIDIYNNATTDTVEDVVLTINGGTFVSTGGYVIRGDANDDKEDGTNIVQPKTKITINDGTFTAQAATKEVIWEGNSADGTKLITINGGTFNSWNKTVAASDKTIPGNADPTVYGVVFSRGDKVLITGGTFNLYSDDGETFNTNGVNILNYGGGKTTITGGTFNGGAYVHVYGSTAGNALSKATKVAMPADGSCEITLTTKEGASVRTVKGDSGIRFQGTITEDAIYYMTNYYAGGDASKIIRGVAIVPVDFLEDAGYVFTLDAITAAEHFWATTNANTGWIDNGDGSYTARLAMKVIEANYNREFVAITYVGYDDDGSGVIDAGETVIYSQNNSGARSIIAVASAALADVRDEKGATDKGVYNTEVTGYYYVKNGDSFTKQELAEGEFKYSRYTAAQVEVLKTYA